MINMLSLDEFKKKVRANEPYLTAISTINAEPIYQMFVSEGEFGQERFESCHFAIEQSIYDGEIIKIDDVLDNFIYDTLPTETEIMLPYEKFFINKYFTYDNFIVCGVAFVKTHYGTAMILPVFDISEKSYGNFDCITGVMTNNKFDINKMDIYDEDVFKDETDEVLREKTKKKANEFMNNVLIYIANTLNILTMKNSDIQYIKKDSSGKSKETLFGVYNPQVRPITRIHVKGELNKYITEYNKIKKSKKFQKLITVRGYWKTYSDDRYVKMKGKTQWIAPYFKGSGKEVMHKFVLVSE